ncbi:MAG: ribosomal protein S2 [Parcubacteria bacterium C7867-005]|nr:MAG: ribosomal protein S2 [Parcubacteria bacterium C7867-005]
MAEKTLIKDPKIDELFKAGAHFGFVKSRRHPSSKPFIFGSKNKIEIFDLEKVKTELEKALKFVSDMGKEGSLVLFVGGKSEARLAVKNAGEAISMPYVNGRWIGGTLTNFPEIRKRVLKLENLLSQKEKGELGKYTKKERLLIDREIAKLNLYFSGLYLMKALPKLLVVIDPKKEHIAVSEAKRMKIPVVALAGTDCNLYSVDYAIPANDASVSSINLITKDIVSAYKSGLAERKPVEGQAETK